MPEQEGATAVPVHLTHEFDSSRTCNYCGIAAERVPGNADYQSCPARGTYGDVAATFADKSNVFVAVPGSLTPEERVTQLASDYDSTFDFCRKGGPPHLEDAIAAAIRAAESAIWLEAAKELSDHANDDCGGKWEAACMRFAETFSARAKP